MTDSMTPRERWLAAIRCEPVDRLPFWPKLDAAYPPYQRGRFAGKTNDDLHAFIGSDRNVWGGNVVRTERTTTAVETTRSNGSRRTVYRAPAGDLTDTYDWDEPSQSWHPVEFPVKSAADLPIMRLIFEDATPAFDPDQYEKAKALVDRVGDDGVVATSIGISPLMEFVEHVAGVENAHYLLVDAREEVEALFAAMHRATCRRAAIQAERSPAPVVYSVENTSTTLISPDQFRRYCKRHLADYGRIITGAGKVHMLHQCGCLKAVLPDVNDLPARGIEAFTAPPVGDTRLIDGRSDCPDKVLVGGTSATLWMYPADRIIAEIARDLDALPHTRGIVVTSAGVMPPIAAPETIKAVCERVKAYPVRN